MELGRDKLEQKYNDLNYFLKRGYSIWTCHIMEIGEKCNI